MTPAYAPTRILLVDDEEVMRAALRELLTEMGIDVVGEAGNGQDAFDLAVSLAPDVILMDVRMPKMDGLAATRLIKEQRPDVRIVVLTAYEDSSLQQRAADAGADVYLVKGTRADDIVAALTPSRVDS